jgi:hypothetical protein
MAHADNSALMRKLKGLLGKELVFRDWAGKTVVSKAPKKRTAPSSPEQAATNVKFLLASRYAKAITTSEDQAMAEAYAMVLKPRQNIYSRALEDFLASPKIRFIKTHNYTGIPGDKILIRAIDDFRVLNTLVEIYRADGALLEVGNAVQNPNGIDWTYTATQNNNLLAGSKIKVIATDVPNNEGMLEITL